MAMITIHRMKEYALPGQNVRLAWRWHYSIRHPELKDTYTDASGNEFHSTHAGAQTLAQARSVAQGVNRRHGGGHTIVESWRK